MFSLKEWLKKAYISGQKSGEFSADYIAIKVAEQVDKGRFADVDAEEVYTAINPDYTVVEDEEE